MATSAPPVQTVTAPTSGEMVGAMVGGTRSGAAAASQGNISAGTDWLSSTLSLLQTEGAAALNPSLRAEYETLNKSVTAANKNDLNKLQSTQTKLADYQSGITAQQKILDDPDATAAQKAAAERKIGQFEERVATAQDSIANLQTNIANQNKRIEDFVSTKIAQAPKGSDVISDAFPELKATLDAAQPFISQMGQLGPAGEALMNNLSGGFQGQQVTAPTATAAQMGAVGNVAAQQAAVAQSQAGLMGPINNVTAQQAAASNMQAAQAQGTSMQAAQGSATMMSPVSNVVGAQASAAQMGNAPKVNAINAAPVSNVQAQAIGASQLGQFGQANAQNIAVGNVGQGAIGSALMNRAMQGIQNAGRLSPEAARDAVQAARQGFAARGMATGNAALAGELLNRDRYARAREFQDLGFAQQVQGSDTSRQFQNVANQLAASQANQSANLQSEMVNLQTRYNAAVQTGDWQQAAAIQNQQSSLQAMLANQSTQAQQSLANQQAGMSAQQANQGAALTAGQTNAQLAQQAALANQSSANTASLANQQKDLTISQTDAASSNQFGMANLSNTQQANLTNAQMGQQNSQFNASQTQQAGQFNAGQQTQTSMFNATQGNQVGLANQQVQFNTGQFNAGQNQQNNQFNAGQQNQSNTQFAQNQLGAALANQQTAFNTGQVNANLQQQTNALNPQMAMQASLANQEDARLGAQLNTGMLSSAYGLQNQNIQQGIGGALLQGQLAGAANPNAQLLGMFSSAQPTGSQALGPAASMANTWATNALGASMFNANANNWGNWQQYAMNNTPSMQSGQGGMLGGLGGAALGAGIAGLGVALAPATFGTSLLPAMATGAALGGGVGMGVGGLFGK